MKNAFLSSLTEFFKAASHLWGRCPHCGELFRLSEAAVSFGSEPPRDWLRRLQKQRDLIQEKLAEVQETEEDLLGREDDVSAREKEINYREKTLNREVKRMAHEYIKSNDRIRTLIRESNKSAVLKSRATLLGKLFERLAPFFQRFNHDPRDIRPILEPIDYICFDGLTVERRVNRITFVEVKAGTSNVTPSERSIIDAVKEGRVSTEVWRFGNRLLPLQQQLKLPGSRS
jgi:predicted Holliday junction resolvase-like endonuclease